MNLLATRQPMKKNTMAQVRSRPSNRARSRAARCGSEASRLLLGRARETVGETLCRFIREYLRAFSATGAAERHALGYALNGVITPVAKRKTLV